jgi:hypothetical protein
VPTDKIRVLVVVNGIEATIDAETNSPIRAVVERALAQTHHTGRPITDWELKDAQGIPLELNRKIKEFHFSSNVVLYLTLVVGVNGCTPWRFRA